jgi:hypothetical protein
MLNKVLRIQFIAGLFLLGTLGMAQAEEMSKHEKMHGEGEGRAEVEYNLPDYYPEHFARKGIIQSIPSSSALYIDGILFKLSTNVSVHSMATEFLTRNALNRGDEIGFSFSKTTNGNLVITEIWILPKGTVPAH